MLKKYYEIEWARGFDTTRRMIERMENPRRPLSLNTTKQYCHAVLLYVRYLKTENPDAALADTRSNIVKHVDKFVDYLMKERKLASKTVRLMFAGLKFWLDANNVKTDKLKKIVLPRSTDVKTEDRKPTKEELKQILSFANIRDKALIEIATSSGLRVNTIADLKMHDIQWNPSESKTEDENEPAMLTVDPAMGRKTTRKFFTFITPEATHCLKEYIAWRKRQKENITPDSYMIGSVYIADKDKKTGHATPFGQAVTGDTLAKTWVRLLENAGLDQKSYKWHELHFHTLRKFFKSECVNAGIKNQYIEFWMGHSGGYLDSSYFRESLKEHIAEYQKAISHLCIYETTTMSDLEKRKQNLIDILKTKPLSKQKIALIELQISQAESHVILDTLRDNIAQESALVESGKVELH
ncbi:tyrosine-type recombinase/integrase, partial [Candidatus Bathyarchaeota archaeon]|nr:tyrosine-type recombinase/integrase [Candidatus Bathyarchaeota archaeon]